jgi:ABC-type antimicrobial peptide transport system permease subunit
MPALSRTIQARNSNLSFEFRAFDSQVEDSLMRERLMATLSAFFGFLAAALATVGLYGVISYMVARRRSEIGIRIALGANRAGIVKLVISEAILLLGIGSAIGIVLAVAAARTTGSLLYGLQPTDPTTITAAIASLAFVAMAASLFPALRAARVEPMEALREE